MLSGIKKTLFERRLKTELKHFHRNNQFYNLQTAKSIAVLFDASEEADYKRVAGFVRHLQSLEIQVYGIGYLKHKLVPHYCQQTLSYDFYTISQQNFFHVPNAPFVADFLPKEYHMLIDLNLNDIPSMKYLAAASRAQFKIGLRSEEYEQIYDFMLQGMDKDNLSGILKELLRYLETLGGINPE